MHIETQQPPVGQSCGTGITVWAAEGLRPQNRIQGIVLISSSLDHHYDLTPALDRVDDMVYNFYSPADPILGLGIPVAGSVDRRRTFTGGQFGFQPPPDAEKSTQQLDAEKLVQRMWQPGDVLEGHYGGHMGATFPASIRNHVAPLIRE